MPTQRHSFDEHATRGEGTGQMRSRQDSGRESTDRTRPGQRETARAKAPRPSATAPRAASGRRRAAGHPHDAPQGTSTSGATSEQITARISRAPTMRVGARRIEVEVDETRAPGHAASRQAATAPTGATPASGGTTPKTATAKATLVLPAAPRELVPVPAPGTSASSVLIPRDRSGSRPVFIRGARRAPRRNPAYRVVPRRTRPRSFATQFLLALSLTVALCSVVALASPLNGPVGLASGFQVYANAVPWVPTPTFTPTATPVPPASAYGFAAGANPGQQAVINDIEAVFGQYASQALKVAKCESGYDPNAVNSYAIGNSHASGVFQILYPSTWDGTSYAADSPFNYDDNIRAAYEIFSRDGYTWREWACASAL